MDRRLRIGRIGRIGQRTARASLFHRHHHHLPRRASRLALSVQPLASGRLGGVRANYRRLAIAVLLGRRFRRLVRGMDRRGASWPAIALRAILPVARSLVLVSARSAHLHVAVVDHAAGAADALAALQSRRGAADGHLSVDGLRGGVSHLLVAGRFGRATSCRSIRAWRCWWEW